MIEKNWLLKAARTASIVAGLAVPNIPDRVNAEVSVTEASPLERISSSKGYSDLFVKLFRHQISKEVFQQSLSKVNKPLFLESISNPVNAANFWWAMKQDLTFFVSFLKSNEIIKDEKIEDKKFVVTLLSKNSEHFWESCLKNFSFFKFVKESGFFEDNDLVKISLKESAKEIWDAIRYDKDKQAKVIEVGIFQNEEFFKLFLKGGGAFQIWSSLGGTGDVEALNFLESVGFFKNVNLFGLSLVSQMGSFWDSLEKNQKLVNLLNKIGFFNNKDFLEITLQGESGTYFWQRYMEGKISKQTLDIYLTPGNESHLVASLKKNILSTGRIWEIESLKEGFAPKKRYLHLAVDEMLTDIKKGERHHGYNELMRIVNLFHHDSHHVYKGKKMRQYIIDNLPARDKFLLVRDGVAELYTSTSSFNGFIFPSIVNDISKAGGFSKYLKEISLDGEKIDLSNLLIAVGRHNLFDKFKDYFFEKEFYPIFFESWIGVEVKGQLSQIAEKLFTLYEILRLVDKNLPESKFLKDMVDALKEKYQVASFAGNIKEKNFFGIAMSLYAANLKGRGVKNIDKSIQEAYETYNISAKEKFIPEKLFSKEGQYLVHRVFMPCIEGGDGDGKMSCSMTVDALAGSGFSKIEKNGVVKMIKIRGNVKIELVASVIKKEDTNSGVDAMLKEIGKEIKGGEESFLSIHTFFFRSHSTFVPEMVGALYDRGLKPDNLILGSCGGVSSFMAFFQAMQSIEMVTSTFQTGSVLINIPIITAFTELVLKHGEKGFASEAWEASVREIINNIKDPGTRNKAKDYLDAYTFPHKNVVSGIVSKLTLLENRTN